MVARGPNQRPALELTVAASAVKVARGPAARVVSRLFGQTAKSGSLMLSLPLSTWPASCCLKLGSDSTVMFRSYQP